MSGKIDKVKFRVFLLNRHFIFETGVGNRTSVLADQLVEECRWQNRERIETETEANSRKNGFRYHLILLLCERTPVENGRSDVVTGKLALNCSYCSVLF